MTTTELWETSAWSNNIVRFEGASDLLPGTLYGVTGVGIPVGTRAVLVEAQLCHLSERATHDGENYLQFSPIAEESQHA